MADQEVTNRYEGHANHIQFRFVVIPIIMNAYNSIHTGRIVTIKVSEIAQDFLDTHGIDRPYVVSALHALAAVNAIQFVAPGDHNDYGLLPSSLITDFPAAGTTGTAEAGGHYQPPSHDVTDVHATTALDGVSAAKKAKAEALAHSRPLDVHTASAHPEVRVLVDEIYKTYFGSGNSAIQKKHIQVILLALYVNWCDDPTLKTGFSRDEKAYKPKSRYNKLHISKTVIAVVDRMIDAGLLECAPGMFNKITGEGYTSRIWPSDTLISKFKVAKFGVFDVSPHHTQECIVLRKAETKKRKDPKTGKLKYREITTDIEYKDTPSTIRMREQLTAYNDLLHLTFVDIPTLDRPFIDLEKKNKKTGRDVILSVNQRDKFVRRIFNRASWDHGGRFWGGWWQRCPKAWRAAIFINEAPVTEIDYSGLHMVILYAKEGVDYWQSVSNLPSSQQDPYTIEFHNLGLDKDRVRSLCKQLVLVALNAKDETAAFQAFREQAETGSFEKSMTNEALLAVLDKLRDKHQLIAHKFASDAGIELMRIDSEITARIIEHFTDNDVPILTVHDSYLVPMGLETELEEQMVMAFEAVTGIANPKLKAETHNPDDWEPQSYDDAQFVSPAAWELAHKWRFDPPRSGRYLYQLSEFKKWLAANNFSWNDAREYYPGYEPHTE